MYQIFVGKENAQSTAQFEVNLYLLRKLVCKSVNADGQDQSDALLYVCSLSPSTVVYKGQLTCPQLEEYFPDLQDKRVESHFAMVHSRFSTNTFPSWSRAHPNRLICHNGEINTIEGNRFWMMAREDKLSHEYVTSSSLTRFGIFISPLMTYFL